MIFRPGQLHPRPGVQRSTRSNLSRPLTNKHPSNDAIRDVIIIYKVECYIIMHCDDNDRH